MAIPANHGEARTVALPLTDSEAETAGTEVDLEMIRRNATSAERLHTAMIDGADHVYTGRESTVARVIADWLTTIA